MKKSSPPPSPLSMNPLGQIAEIAGLDARRRLIRIPPELDVPLTDRVERLLDTPEFRRLADVAQLGLVALVYPGARHTRFEHSLGVYRLALLFLARLAHDARFVALVRPHEAELLIVAALLHDIGHWPYCHLIEDLAIPEIPPHESIARRFLAEGPIAELLRRDWQIDSADVLSLIERSEIVRRPKESKSEFLRRQKVFHLFMSILSGPVDIDKMDYLFRDSLAAGVPYGRHFDQARLIGSLCLNEAGDGLAVTDKGKTAAELMVFARYVMFSEVYWHHTVRAATVMFQRAFEILLRLDPDSSHRGKILLDAALTLPVGEWIERLRQSCREGGDRFSPRSEAESEAADALRLLNGVFGPVRHLYKRVRQFSILEEPSIYRALAGRPTDARRSLAAKLIRALGCHDDFCARCTAILGRPLGPNDLLIDAPPVHKEIEFSIDVHDPRDGSYRPLNEISPVVRALAREQFDDSVKKVRIFSPPEIAPMLRSLPDLNRLLAQELGCELARE